MHSYVVADVFTDVPLQGNQLAVFTDGSGLSDEVMQRTARELSLSETVFLLPGEDGADARARIFTPIAELPFAGHPVLGAAFVVAADTDAPVVRLQTAAGVIPVAVTREGDRVVFGEMDQPIPDLEPFAQAAELLAALRLERSELPIDGYRNGPLHVYVALESETAVAALAPDTAALAALGAIGVSCFTAAGSRVKTRMFAPGLGVPEDPATGSAAGPLCAYLHRRTGLERVEILQGVEIGRPSRLSAEMAGDRVRVAGNVMAVIDGTVTL